MADWYVSVNGGQAGPFPEAEFERMRARGLVPQNAFVWREGMANWILASELPGGASAAPPPPPITGPSPGIGPSAYPFATGGQQFGAAPYGAVTPAASPNGLVVAAYVLGGLALLCSCFTGLPAIICAAIAMGQPEQRRHATLALIVSIVCTGVGMIIGIVLNALFAPQNGF